MGDIIIWDNRFLSHTSGRNTGPEEETMMRRVNRSDVGLRAAGDGPFGNLCARARVDDFDDTLAVHDIANPHIEAVSVRIERQRRRLVHVQRDVSDQLR